MELKNRKIDLFGSKYSIKFVDKIVTDENTGHEVFGETDSNQGLILVAKTLYSKKIPESEIKLTLLHELTHAILDCGQFQQESSNEALVEWIAKCLNQLLKKNII